MNYYTDSVMLQPNSRDDGDGKGIFLAGKIHPQCMGNRLLAVAGRACQGPAAAGESEISVDGDVGGTTARP